MSGNNKVWRRVAFASVTTSKLRVVVTAALAGHSRITEVEAYGPVGAADVRWLVSDHLGTPRMVFDRTGSLPSADGQSGMSRHDYFPFGEELGVGVSARTTDNGYRQTAVARQGFTGKERDEETGLDYFTARYYAPGAGRFTSPDPVQLSEEHLLDPQRWNAYTYVGNNPLALIDPDGRNGVGQDGKLIITVFLNFAKEELDAGEYKGDKFVKAATLDKPDWKGLQKTARDNGFELVIREDYKGLSLDNSAYGFAHAAKESELIVVAGHRGRAGDGSFLAISLSENSAIIPAGVSDVGNAFNNSGEVEFAGKAIAYFGCNTDAVPIDSMIKPSDPQATYIAVKDGDGQGGASVPNNNRAAFAYVQRYVTTNGNIPSARESARQTYRRSILMGRRTDGKPGLINHDIKDEVTSRPIR